MEEREVMLEEEIMEEETVDTTEKKSGIGPVAGMAIGAGLTLLTMWGVKKVKKFIAKRKEENQISCEETIEGSYTDKSES
jgi:hypothetical protein